MLGSSIRRVGLIDHRNVPPRDLRAAPQHIATQRLSRWGSPAARARLARTVLLNACGSETPTAASRRLRGDLTTRARASPAPPDPPVHAGGPYFGGCKSP